MRKLGKKGLRWKRERVKRIKEALADGRLSVIDGRLEGIDLDTGVWGPLEPDHKRKRSLGGSDDEENIEWVGLDSHKERDQMGDPKKKKTKKRKVDWQTEHKCKSCKAIVSLLICPFCNKISV